MCQNTSVLPLKVEWGTIWCERGAGDPHDLRSLSTTLRGRRSGIGAGGDPLALMRNRQKPFSVNTVWVIKQRPISARDLYKPETYIRQRRI